MDRVRVYWTRTESGLGGWAAMALAVSWELQLLTTESQLCHVCCSCTAELCSGLLYILALLFGSGQFGACYGETWLTRCPGFR